MQNSTPTKQRDILHTQNNVNETPKENSSLITREKIDDSPFWIVGTEEKGYFISMGKYRLTEPTKTIKEAIETLEKEKWNIISNMIGIIHTLIDNGVSKTQDTNK